MQKEDIKIYPVIADLRLQRNHIAGIECPFGMNSYVVGSLSANNIKVYTNFDAALEQFINDVKN